MLLFCAGNLRGYSSTLFGHLWDGVSTCITWDIWHRRFGETTALKACVYVLPVLTDFHLNLLYHPSINSFTCTRHF